ncbi:MAG: cryptochrome/photolyase family protein [Balneolales bacterium]|nr:cryptochrome/photolyase family protein [Balneolales bacterium]
MNEEPRNNWLYVHPDQLSTRVLQDAQLSNNDNPGSDIQNSSGSDKNNEKPGILLIESTHRYSALPFHKKRIIFELSAMRHFALECQNEGYTVSYHITDQPFDAYLKLMLNSSGRPEAGIFERHEPSELPSADEATWLLHAMCPASHDERVALEAVCKEFSANVDLKPNAFFLANADEYTDKIAPGYRMEFFYRDMRRKFGLLMDGDNSPAGGDWNFDKENRKSLPKKISLPEFPQIQTDDITQEVISFVNNEFPDYYGDSAGFSMATTRTDAEKLADHFFDNCLADFGPFEDAMAKGEAHIFHSGLSSYMNVGLLDPLQLCVRAEQAYRDGNAPINSVEGFIRQIIGWREFIRVYYEAKMPEVREANSLGFKRGLPDVFWSAKSGMACVDDCVGTVKTHAWSHHIPRLMVLSNFSNLTETNPYDLYLWFWYAYSDAHDWVVLPNVLGMSTFADGGILASKPYVSGGNYINKMSNYCKSCSYKISLKTGEEACPFNYLYWNFVDNHRDVFEENGRVSFMVNMFDKRSDEDKKAIKESANTFIENLERWDNEQNYGLESN